MTCIILGGVAVCALSKEKPDHKARPEPTISSIYPVAAQQGTTFEASLRGSGLVGARDILFEDAGLEARILRSEADPESPDKDSPKDLLRLQVAVSPDAKPGRHDFRVVTPRGVSNKIPVDVVTEPVLDESSESSPLRRFPVVVNGRIAHAGECDSFWIEAGAGQILTLQAKSLSDGFDPSLAVAEKSGSWFDPDRFNEIASNDEPLSFPGLSTDARLVERFPHAGKYRVQVKGFSGQGGADFVYELRIFPGVTPAPDLHPKLADSWEERQFTRQLKPDRLEELARRGGVPADSKAVETYHAVPQGSEQIPVMSAPGVIDGHIAQAGERHVIRLKIDKPQNLAIEVETPQATLPRFNPVVRVMEPGGREVATDVYTKAQ